MTALRSTSPCFNCLTKRFPVHLKQFNLFTTPCWKQEICCVVLIVPQVFTEKVLKIQLEWKFSWIFHGHISFRPKLWKFNDSDSHRERWMMMIANTKAACSIFVFQWNVFFFFFSRQKSRACAEVNNVQDEWQRTVEQNPLFWKAHPHSFKHSHRERFPGGQRKFTVASHSQPSCEVSLHRIKWQIPAIENDFHLIFCCP